jgi:hypothetical protein
MSLYLYFILEFFWYYTLCGFCRTANTILLGTTANFVPLVIMEMRHKDHHLIAWSVLVLYQFQPTSKWPCLAVLLLTSVTGFVCVCVCVCMWAHARARACRCMHALELKLLANKTCGQNIMYIFIMVSLLNTEVVLLPSWARTHLLYAYNRNSSILLKSFSLLWYLYASPAVIFICMLLNT